MKVERKRNLVHLPTSVVVIQRKETIAENRFMSPANGSTLEESFSVILTI